MTNVFHTSDCPRPKEHVHQTEAFRAASRRESRTEASIVQRQQSSALFARRQTPRTMAGQQSRIIESNSKVLSSIASNPDGRASQCAYPKKQPANCKTFFCERQVYGCRKNTPHRNWKENCLNRHRHARTSSTAIIARATCGLRRNRDVAPIPNQHRHKANYAQGD